MNKKIKNIINDWDPMGLIIMNNDDEYSNEINEIEKFIETTKNVDVKILSKKIQEIFEQSFSEEMFAQTKDTVDSIASKIINDIFH